MNFTHFCEFWCFSLGKQSENSRRLWLFLGSVRGFSRKTPGKCWENCWKIFPESRNATNSRIWGSGKGKPAGNLGPTLPGPCPHLPSGVFFLNRQLRPFRVLLKQARFTLDFCSGMPLRKVHEPTFLWFGLPGPLLIIIDVGTWKCKALDVF